MRTTINLDDDLLEQAHFYTGIKERTALIHEECPPPLTVAQTSNCSVASRNWAGVTRTPRPAPVNGWIGDDSRRYLRLD